MKWIKKGQIFSPPGDCEWMSSHAALPCALSLNDDMFRIFFSTRNSSNRSQIGFIDIDINQPENILHISSQPALDLGPLGYFDDCGILMSCIAKKDSDYYLYYSGMNEGVSVLFYVAIGLARADASLTKFTRCSSVPIVGRSERDPVLCGSPSVLFDDGIWKMWYMSAERWERRAGAEKLRHYYHIRYAQSPDGISWNYPKQVCIDFDRTKDEYAFGRPCVIKDGALYKMWYCYRGGTETYRIGYAESSDGKVWTRKDNQVGINISTEGWDSEMICYPFVFKHKGTTYMLYNGNRYGKTGIGYAVLEE